MGKDSKNNKFGHLYQDYAYGKAGDPYAGDRITKLKRLIEKEVIELLNSDHKNLRILDTGCGDGFFLELLREELKLLTHADQVGIQLFGVDISSQAVEKSNSRGFASKLSDVNEEIPCDDGFFDIVFSTELIEHLVNTDKYMTELKRIIKKDGTLILTTPNLAAWFNRILLFINFQPIHTEVSLRESYFGRRFLYKVSGREWSKPMGHLRLFTLRALLDFMKYHGFEIRRVNGYCYHPIPLNRVISNLFPSLADGMIVIAKAGSSKT